jgi:hypothetical protein
MTEAEWLECLDPRPMLTYLRGKVSERKLRLFACACAWRVERWFPAPCCRQAVLVAEQMAEGEVGEIEVKAASDPFWPLELELLRNVKGPGLAAAGAARWTLHHAALPAAREVNNFCRCVAVDIACPRKRGQRRPADYNAKVEAATRDEWKQQAELLRDVVGLPSRRWLRRMAAALPGRGGENAARIARSIWQDRDFAALPVLADALEEAGCVNEDILGHLRKPGLHRRGCWVVDLVLNKG